MNEDTLRDIKYEVDKLSFRYGSDDVIKVEDLMNLLSNMLEDGEEIVSKEELRYVVESVLKEHHSKLVDELWREIDKRLEE